MPDVSTKPVSRYLQSVTVMETFMRKIFLAQDRCVVFLAIKRTLIKEDKMIRYICSEMELIGFYLPTCRYVSLTACV